MTLLIKLVLAHFLGDFVLQPGSWVSDKITNKHRSRKLYLHVFIHATVTFLLVAEPSWWLPVAIIAVSHYFIDLAKVNFEKSNHKVVWFITDQLLHLAVIGVVWYQWQQPNLQWQYFHPEKALILLTAIVLLTSPSSVLIKIFISHWTPDTMYTVKSSLPDAGKYIGYLERLFVLGFVLTGHWEAVGFLLAAKSVFRFGDLKESRDRKLTEYVLIGTLLSFGIALLVAMVTSKLIEIP